MSHSTVRTRIVAIGAAAAALTGLALATGPQALASTIPDGHIQICAQGSYWAEIDVWKDSAGNGPAALSSGYIAPGTCWKGSLNTNGTTRRVGVSGALSSSPGRAYDIGAVYWNSKTGLGIGAEGDLGSFTATGISGHPYLWTW
jgi:hypothetical protein